ncbi:hypothetical protein AVEN_203095-1 [Araneus ventricosus]|uniref:Uncharacterized protein n=1 Tax=Araneus ventricosus TaxID=182803 RepID=A0A4Y2DT86_ARAVE|nr:hypothetical protein AVEN_203095-1 [Araneus ventricosus]
MFHGHALSTSIRARNFRAKASRFGRSALSCHCRMSRKILRTVLTGMSKVREIPRALHVRKALLDASCNAVATSSTDVEAIAFLPLPHFTSNEPLSSNLSIFFRRNAVIGPEPLLKPFNVLNFFNAIAAQSPFF